MRYAIEFQFSFLMYGKKREYFCLPTNYTINILFDCSGGIFTDAKCFIAPPQLDSANKVLSNLTLGTARKNVA